MPVPQTLRGQGEPFKKFLEQKKKIFLHTIRGDKMEGVDKKITQNDKGKRVCS